MCVPFSCTSLSADQDYAFRLVTYSNVEIAVEKSTMHFRAADKIITGLHKELLTRDLKILYPVAKEGKLVCVHGEGCLYFIALNSSLDQYLSIKIILDLPEGLISFGHGSDSYDVPPKSQKVCLVVMSNGRQSNATHLKFRYLSSTVAVKHAHCFTKALKLTSALELSLPGDRVGKTSDSGLFELTGEGNIEVYHWIPQLGAIY